jgi:protein-disulfide isomerase
MKPNVILALLAGLVVGFVVGRAVNGQSGSSGSTVMAPGGGGGGETEAALELKSADMPAGTFTGMTDSQKFAVMKVMNDNMCDCGCDKGTLAHCIKEDPNCPKSPAKLKQAVDLAKQGKSAQQIQAEMFGAAARVAAKPAANNDQQVFKVDDNGKLVHGDKNALVTIVEYSDYQCPFCGRANSTVEQLEKDYGDKVRVVMKQNPLPFHDRAKPAALAALAAGEQGKYTQMHHLLFTNQTKLDDASLEGYAKEAGVNVAKWKEDMKKPQYADLITKEQGEAAALGASGTPTFFINGRKLVGAMPIDQFKTVIDQEYTKADGLVRSGTPRDQVYAKVMATAGSAAPAAPAPAAPGPPPATAKKIEFPPDAPMKGSKTAKVTIVEWSDYQCPFCGRVEPTIKQVEDKYGKDVRIVWRNQPLPFHPNAKPAAIAAMAAGDQGKFWEYHDKLFANQQQLSPENYEKWAQELGLNMSRFKADVTSGKYDAKLAADMAAGAAAGANGTPTFFIDGRQVVGAQPLTAFTAVIDDELQKADKLLKSGVKPDKLYERLMADAAAAAPAPAAAAPAAPPAVQDVAVGAAPIKGPSNAPVTIVEWSDFQCPFCSRVEPTIKQIEDQYGSKVKVAWKNQPLPFHPFARPAAMAAMAANEQGKFWEYHDKLFANQQQLDRASLERYAQELGLDMSRFKAALDSNKFESQIQADSAEGTRLGANGTPTFFINGRQVIGAQPIEAFKSIIDEELKKKGR